MHLSVSIKLTDEGYVPRLVLDIPKSITVFPVGKPCSTFQEAWIIARTAAKNHTFTQEVHA